MSKLFAGRLVVRHSEGSYDFSRTMLYYPSLRKHPADTDLSHYEIELVTAADMQVG